MDSEYENIETLKYFLEQWLNATISQSSVFLTKLQSSNSNLEDPFHKQRMFDEHYILTATAMSVRFARRLNQKLNIPNNVLDEFLKATEPAITVRDMREHSDEYFCGTGRKQNQFHKNIGNGIECDLSSSIQTDDGYMLGNSISLETIKRQCQLVLGNYIKQIKHKLFL